MITRSERSAFASESVIFVFSIYSQSAHFIAYFCDVFAFVKRISALPLLVQIDWAIFRYFASSILNAINRLLIALSDNVAGHVETRLCALRKRNISIHLDWRLKLIGLFHVRRTYQSFVNLLIE